MDSKIKTEYLCKVIIIGEANVGKSSLLRKYCENTFNDNYVSTIGIDFRCKKIHIGNKIANMQIWDTAGQERYRNLTKAYYRYTKGCIIMYDI